MCKSLFSSVDMFRNVINRTYWPGNLFRNRIVNSEPQARCWDSNVLDEARVAIEPKTI